MLFYDLAFCLYWQMLIGKKEESERTTLKTELSGFLVPSNDPSPSHHCGPVPFDALTIYLGTSVVFSNHFPYTAIQIAGEVLLGIDKGLNGISVSGKTFSADSRIIAEIDHNEFHINPNNYFRKERPDRHTLIVYDQHGRKVLYVRYLNLSAIYVLGMFNFPGRPAVMIEENIVRIGPLTFHDACFGLNETAVQID